MKTIYVEQRSDEWFNFRRGKVTGTKVDGLLKHSTTHPTAYWDLLAETMAEPADETPIRHGVRMEPENIHATLKKLNIPEEEADADPGMWLCDDGIKAVSPDCCEASITPTWAIECKSLTSAKHLEAVAPILERTDETDYMLIPDRYKAQCLQYFVVNEQLQTLYFSMYDDRIREPWAGKWAHVILTINREDIQVEITEQTELLDEAITDLLNMEAIR